MALWPGNTGPDRRMIPWASVSKLLMADSMEAAFVLIFCFWGWLGYDFRKTKRINNQTIKKSSNPFSKSPKTHPRNRPRPKPRRRYARPSKEQLISRASSLQARSSYSNSFHQSSPTRAVASPYRTSFSLSSSSSSVLSPALLCGSQTASRTQRGRSGMGSSRSRGYG